MSIVEPEIDVLFDRTDYDRFLLCAEASKRANDIDNMMHGQHVRALSADSAVEIARANHNRSLSIAFNEIADGVVECDPNSIDITQH